MATTHNSMEERPEHRGPPDPGFPGDPTEPHPSCVLERFLGLYIASQMAELHGGRVTLDSKPGQGSVFAVVLPL
jgi:hypothetical protein